MVINVKESPGHFCSYRQNSRQCKRLLWRVEQAQMSLLKKNSSKNTEGTNNLYISSQVYGYVHRPWTLDLATSKLPSQLLTSAKLLEFYC